MLATKVLSQLPRIVTLKDLDALDSPILSPIGVHLNEQQGFAKGGTGASKLRPSRPMLAFHRLFKGCLLDHGQVFHRFLHLQHLGMVRRHDIRHLVGTFL